ncbi:glutamyl-tRNA reductase [Pontibacter sp. G13]|uniref:glutamyl-tRNA reductase n=1 Tax=Pontibacter sp. G13 TaxID=3074898 RepID=UPI00288B1811|nr:glutamyl-tRNA reductase [Pontibacter sp. G13]WNJ20889.1 glutamyl-tRNA reductase [Pontibacter sp. G13]
MGVPFKAVRLTHLQAPIDIRELIYLPEETCSKLLLELKELLDIREALIFSTCNRTEVYYVSPRDLSREIIGILCLAKGITNPEAYEPYFEMLCEEQAVVKQLFEVSMGLQSTVLGDLQIANQVKRAYALAHEAEMAEAYLHRLMHTIFHTNKRVQQETPYRDGAASVSYASTELATEVSSHLINPSALVIGMGEMGTDVARNLEMDAFGKVDLTNRTRAKAEPIAAETGATVIDFDQVPEVVGDYHVILSCVSVEKPLITKDMLLKHKADHLFLIDLGVPRTIAKEVEELPHVVLYTVDDIENMTARTLERRKGAIEDVKRIIQTEMEAFLSWRSQLSISPTIQRIKSALEQIRKDEMARFLKNANPKEAKLIEDITKSMMNKIMKKQVLTLKEACKRGEEGEMIDLLTELFDLEKETERHN